MDDAQARRTDDPERLIVATATATPGTSADNVVAALEEGWTGSLQYNYRAGHVIRKDVDSIRLSAITQIAPDGFYVTADVTVLLRD